MSLKFLDVHKLKSPLAPAVAGAPSDPSRETTGRPKDWDLLTEQHARTKLNLHNDDH